MLQVGASLIVWVNVQVGAWSMVWFNSVAECSDRYMSCIVAEYVYMRTVGEYSGRAEYLLFSRSCDATRGKMKRGTRFKCQI